MTDARSSRAAEATRRALVEAATAVFAQHGYRGGSVRMITQAAGANQAAITYHFNGKDGLYRAVLRAAVAAFERDSIIPEDAARRDRGELLRLIMRQLLVALTQPGRLGRYLQILSWEGVHPSPVYLAFFAEERPRLFATVEHLVQRFLGDDATAEEIAIVSHWVLQQPIAIVRNAERLRAPPYSLALDEAGVERIADWLTALSLHGLLEAPAKMRLRSTGR